MSPSEFSRRDAFRGAGLAAGGALLASATPSRAETTRAMPFKYCLNMSTIRGQNLDAAQEIEIAGVAGYDGIEPWMGKLNDYVSKGGSLKDLKKRIDDHGMTVESAIGFAKWIVNDETQRKKGLEDAKKDMETLAQIGGTRIAAPPAGVPRGEKVELDAIAERYHALLELGDQTGVVPQIEMWGGNPTIGTVSKAIYIAIRSGHPKACFLGDVFHTYKGGSDFSAFRLLSAKALQAFHMNDYPADPPQDKIRDEHRVYPGDGIGPVVELLKTFREIGAAPALSLELFNRDYWKEDAAEVAKTGLAKMKAVVAKAGA